MPKLQFTRPNTRAGDGARPTGNSHARAAAMVDARPTASVNPQGARAPDSEGAAAEVPAGSAADAQLPPQPDAQHPPQPDTQHAPQGAPRRSALTWAATAAIVLLLAAALANLLVGATGIPLDRGLAALTGTGSPDDTALIMGVRLPRTLLAALVGVNLAVAGLLAQTLTRNPLASAQTFGINAGAALAVVLATVAWGLGGTVGTVAAFVGALAAGALMWLISTLGRFTVVGLALAGMTLQISLTAIVQAILVMNNETQSAVFWLAGSVTGGEWPDVRLIAPFSIAVTAAVVILRRRIALLALDTTTGRALGTRPEVTGGVVSILITLLAGSAVAVAGPIGFVGLVVPHIAKRLVGGGFGSALTLCIVGGPLLLVSADLLARLVAFPAETPVGIITAVCGTPVFLALVLRRAS